MHSKPDLVAYFFMRRCELFFEHILKPIFNISDFWDRYEWQWRGSPHMHGLLWFHDAPDLDKASFTDEEIEIVRLYFDHLCCAINPSEEEFRSNPSTRDSNPCRRRFSDVPEEERLADLNQLLNYFQRHTQCGDHCLRRDRRNPEVMVCRFKFPILPLREESAVELEDSHLEFYPRRNDQWMGRFNAFVTQVKRKSNCICFILIQPFL